MRPRREKDKKEIVLPSGGYANRTAFPDGKITVFPWDSIVDDWLNTTMQRGTPEEKQGALFNVLAKVSNLNGCLLNDFVLGDVNAVLLCSRSIQNDSYIEYGAICPDCANEEVDKIRSEDLTCISPKGPDYKGSDSLTLPKCQDVIELRPLRVEDELKIGSRAPENKALVSDHIAHAIAGIVSVNGTQPERIQEMVQWYLALPTGDAAFLEQQEDLLTPHLDLRLPQRCTHCGYLYYFRMTLDAEFFRSGRLGADRRALAANIQSRLGRQ